MNFDEAFALLIDHEKGFQKGPNDRGNWTTGIIGKGELKGTKYGISAMTYPYLDVENLTLDRAKEIYKTDWWERMKCDLMPGELAFQVFDAAVNHGRENAIRFLQKALGVADDGHIGPVTLKALDKEDKMYVIVMFNVERAEFMTKISTFNEHGRGWIRRVLKNIRRIRQ